MDILQNFDIDQFHFLRPVWLWAILPAFLIFLSLWWDVQRTEKWTRSIASHLRGHVFQKGNSRVTLLPKIFLLVVWIIAAVAAAGPAWEKVEKPGGKSEAVLTIVLDLSQSMLATDIQPNRLEHTKFKILDLIAANPRARSVLIVYAGTAHTAVPYTSDYENIKLHLDALHPEIMPVRGTNLEYAMNLADSLMQKIVAPSTILLITDQLKQEEIGLLSAYQSMHNLVVMPMATQSGSSIPLGKSKTRVINDKSGNPVISKIENSALRSLAQLPGVDVAALTLDNSDVEMIAEKIKSNLEFQEDAEIVEEDWVDEGFWLLIPLLVFSLFWFRRGWQLRVGMIICFLNTSCQSQYKWDDLWYSRDYQAQKMEDSGSYADAAELYDNPLRKGNAYYKAGDYEAAAEAYESDTSANGLYNLGLANIKLGRYQEALTAFGMASEKDSTMTSALHDQQKLESWMAEQMASTPQEGKDLEGAPPEGEQMENTSTEDLSGGGQEATEEQMKQQRLTEQVATDIRTAEELTEVPEDFQGGQKQDASKILLKKINDSPGEFLRRKFEYQVKKYNMQTEETDQTW